MKKLIILMALLLFGCGEKIISEEFVFSLSDNACYKITETESEILAKQLPCDKVPIDQDCRNTWESYKNWGED